MKKKALIIFVLLSLGIILITLFFYSSSVLLSVNPFYKREVSGGGDLKRYWRYSILPTVKAEVPEGWKLKTKIFEENQNFATEIVESEMVIGDVAFEIYKGDESVVFLSYVTDTGGIGGVYYNFPDSDPEIYKDMLEKSIENNGLIGVEEVKEGEYSKFDLFGIEVRRVDRNYVPNINEKDTYYFTNPLSPVLFFFGEDGPHYEVYYNGEESESDSKYYLWVMSEDISEEDLAIADSILKSMELK